MTEEQTEVVQEEFGTPATEDTAQVTETVEEVETQEAPEETDADRNFRALREERERDRLRADQAEREAMQARLQAEAYEKALRASGVNAQQQTEPEGPDPDDWATYGEVNKLKSELESIKMQEMQRRMRSEMPDFNEVVNQENLRKFEALEPEIASVINEIKDPWKAGVTAYKYLKKTLPQETPQQAQSKQRIAENSRKPGSVASVGSNTPLAAASSYEGPLTAEMKAALWRETCEAAKGV